MPNNVKKVLVEESLLNSAATSIEQANIYFNALCEIMRIEPETEEGKNIRNIAVEALIHARDKGLLSQDVFEEI